MADNKIQLPKEVGEEYELVNYPNGFGPEAVWPQGKVNVNTMSLARAKALEARKWPFLRKRNKAQAAAKKEDSTKK
jgi:hypothetical protein